MKSVTFKQLSLLPLYARLSLKRESEYRLAFYMFILNQALFVGLWLLFWRVLLNRIGTFGVWDFPMVALITGFVAVSQGIAFMFINIYRVPTEILTGTLNMHLIKPVHPFLHLVCKRLNLNSAPRIFVGAAIIIGVLFAYDISFTWLAVLMALLVSILGFFAVMIPFAMLGMLAFWIGKAEFIRDLFVELFVFQNYPLSEFPGFFVVTFTFILPLIFTGTFPVLMLTQFTLMQSFLTLVIALGLVIIQIVLFNIMWRKGLKRYESYGG